MFFMNYYDVKNAVWDALSEGAMPSTVMNQLTLLASACFKKACAEETPSYDRADWLRADAYCQALRDGINGALFVREHPSTPYAKRRAESEAKAKARERATRILEVEPGREKTPSQCRSRAAWDRAQAELAYNPYLRSAHISSAEAYERLASEMEGDSRDLEITVAKLEEMGVDPVARELIPLLVKAP